MLVITGGAGFIGSNIIKGLNKKGYHDILVVDNLARSEKFKNLLPLKFIDYLDKKDFIERIENNRMNDAKIDMIIHQGACTDTMKQNAGYILNNNYEYSKTLLYFCLQKEIPFIYASSASVYGNGENGFKEDWMCENALNAYAFSKLLFDRYVRKVIPSAKSKVIGLRYFNVYGPQENHKGRMASIIYQFYQQLKKDGVIRLFKGIDGYGNGEQRRDFIYVGDVVKVNLFFMESPPLKGIFNCGTGQSRSFNDVARALIDIHGNGKIEYIDFPEPLKGKYQNFTEADLTNLRGAGYKEDFIPLEDGIRTYYHLLEHQEGYLY